MHEHVWTPIDGAHGAYACPCGSIGKRVLKTGAIREAHAAGHGVTARPRLHGHGGRIPPKYGGG